MRKKQWYDERHEHTPIFQEQTAPFCSICYRQPCMCCPTYFIPLRDGTPFPTDLTPRGTDEERAFVSAIAAAPDELTIRLVFADWLDVRGRTDEAAVLRDRKASPIIAPFRVLPYWRAAPFFSELLQREPHGVTAVVLATRLELHDMVHGGRPRARTPDKTQVTVLNDEEAVLAQIDRWPLMPGEEPTILRMGNKPLVSVADEQ